MSCLSDENLAALVGGSATAEQRTMWNAHIAKCDSCAVQVARREHAAAANATVAPAQSAAGNDASDPDATITFKPVGKPNLDVKADQLPADAIPGYKILKELHRGGQGVVYQAVQLVERTVVGGSVVFRRDGNVGSALVASRAGAGGATVLIGGL